ncbi:unnamed protein product [Mesocestoides corti]|uniref:NAC domain-containing protein n=1 Tax=Mesocestoides corti TaxID=53468 RepID=A0A0R3UIG5_MESCO|nr:unnamed protein product [Mesocestoides corti]
MLPTWTTVQRLQRKRIVEDTERSACIWVSMSEAHVKKIGEGDNTHLIRAHRGFGAHDSFHQRDGEMGGLKDNEWIFHRSNDPNSAQLTRSSMGIIVTLVICPNGGKDSGYCLTFVV